MTYEQAIQTITRIPKFSTSDTFSNTRELIRRLGNPENSMKVIHIAGTNGKGSVSAFISSMLVKSGKKVGLFTSPHLVHMNERFQINHVPVSDEVFARAFEDVNGVCREMIADGCVEPTFFDVLFAMGLVIFKEEQVEIAVLETGMGGRKDATNVIEHPMASVITSISLDHTEILGDTISKIAGEKAGIIKQGVPVIYDGRNEEAAIVIEETAQKQGSVSSALKDSMIKIEKTHDTSIDFRLNVPYYEGCVVRVPFPAPYQVINSGLALLAMESIDPEHEISVDTRLAGIRETRWQGRMETVLPGVIVDGAHNEDGIREFVRTLQQVKKDRRVVILFSAVVEKNIEEMVKTICEAKCFDEVVVTEIKGSRNVPAAEIAELYRRYTDVPVSEEKRIADAFERANQIKQDGLLFCVGSLYLVGEIKGLLEEKQNDQL